MKKKIEIKYEGMGLYCDHCGESIRVDWEDDCNGTKLTDMPFYNGDMDGSEIEGRAEIDGWLNIDGKNYCEGCWDFFPFTNTPDKFRNQYDDYEGLVFLADGSVYEIEYNGLDNVYKRLDDE